MAQIKNIKKPGEQIRGADVGFAGLDKNGNIVGTGITEDDLFELPEGAQTGDVLAWGGETGAEWRPHYPDGGNEGDVLKLGETGPEWADAPAELPAIASGDAGKVLSVNSGETGVEWATPSGGSTKVYHHYMRESGHGFMWSFITTSATPFTLTTWKQMIDAIAPNKQNEPICKATVSLYNDDGTMVILDGITYSGVIGHKISDGSLVYYSYGSTFTDNVDEV